MNKNCYTAIFEMVIVCEYYLFDLKINFCEDPFWKFATDKQSDLSEQNIPLAMIEKHAHTWAAEFLEHRIRSLAENSLELLP